jgi:hypothetical protein
MHRISEVLHFAEFSRAKLRRTPCTAARSLSKLLILDYLFAHRTGHRSALAATRRLHSLIGRPVVARGGARPPKKSAEWERPGAGTALEQRFLEYHWASGNHCSLKYRFPPPTRRAFRPKPSASPSTTGRATSDSRPLRPVRTRSSLPSTWHPRECRRPSSRWAAACTSFPVPLAAAIHTDAQDLDQARDWMRRISEFTSESVKTIGHRRALRGGRSATSKLLMFCSSK